MNTQKPNKYFIYARKSSEGEDRQITSVEDQISESTKLAERLGLDIVDVIYESKSAKAPGRKAFNRMLKRIQNGEAHGVLCWKLNRLARNSVDGGNIIWLLQNNILRHIQTQGNSYRSGDNVIMMYMEFGMANQYVNDLSVDVKRGMRNKAERGWYPCSVLPIGYVHNSTETSDTEIITDPKRYSMVKQLWKLLLTGNYSVSDIKREAIAMGLLNRKGNSYALNTFFKLFENEFYTGCFKWRNEQGELIKHIGKHKPMITQLQFKKVQTILEKKGRPTRVNKLVFPYRGTLSCGECGCAITAEQKLQVRCTECRTKFSYKNRDACPKCNLHIKKMKGANFMNKKYYRCTKKKKPCSQPYIEEAQLTAIIMDRLKDICIDKDFFKLAISYIEAYEDDDDENIKTIRSTLLKKQTKLQHQLQQFNRLRADGEITAEELIIAKKDINEQLENIITHLEEEKNHALQWKTLVKKEIFFSLDIISRFEKGDVFKKQEILSRLGSNQKILDKSLYFTRDFTSELLQEWHQLYRNEKHRLEPEKSLILYSDLDGFEHQSSRLLRRYKLVRPKNREIIEEN